MLVAQPSVYGALNVQETSVMVGDEAATRAIRHTGFVKRAWPCQWLSIGLVKLLLLYGGA